MSTSMGPVRPTNTLAMVSMALLLVVACGADTTAPRGAASSASASSSTQPSAGDPAVWMLDSSSLLTSASDTFTARITRLGCSGGVTGNVLDPDISLTDTQVVVTFKVEALPVLGSNAGYTCPGNDRVDHIVKLGAPIGSRVLVDGNCLPGRPAERTAFCEDHGERWHPSG
jgi:hypothetical protein